MSEYCHNVRLVDFSDFILNNVTNKMEASHILSRKSKMGVSRDSIHVNLILDVEVFNCIKEYVSKTKALGYDCGFGVVPGERTNIYIVRTHLGSHFNLDVPVYFFVAKVMHDKYNKELPGYNLVKDLLDKWDNNIAKTYMFNKFRYIHIDGNVHNYSYDNIVIVEEDNDTKLIEEARCLLKFYHDNQLYKDELYKQVEKCITNKLSELYASSYGSSATVVTQCQDIVRKNGKLYAKLADGRIVNTKCPFISERLLKYAKEKFNIDLAHSTEEYLKSKYPSDTVYCIRDGKDNVGRNRYVKIDIHTMTKLEEHFIG